MGTTVNRQKAAKADMDQKLALSRPDRALLEELATAVSKTPGSQQATFQYAFALAKSEPSELRYAVNMLDGLVEGFEHQIDCMFGAATALYLLGDFDESRVSQLTKLSLCRILQFGINCKVDSALSALSMSLMLCAIFPGR